MSQQQQTPPPSPSAPASPTPSPEPAKCRTCGAAIFWLKHYLTGKLAPIDAEPSPDGNVLIEGVEHYMTMAKDLFGQSDRPRHKNHFATCPQADQHHKGKRR
jgi:hypothetical protein